MCDTTLYELTIDKFHRHLQRGELSVVELVRGYLDRIGQYDRNTPELNAVVTVNESALDRARVLDLH